MIMWQAIFSVQLFKLHSFFVVYKLSKYAQPFWLQILNVLSSLSEWSRDLPLFLSVPSGHSESLDPSWLYSRLYFKTICFYFSWNGRSFFFPFSLSVICQMVHCCVSVCVHTVSNKSTMEHPLNFSPLSPFRFLHSHISWADSLSVR